MSVSKQLLVLLLVIDADLDQARHVVREAVGAEPGQRVVDMRTISQHAVARRPGQHATPRSRLTRPLALVVGVEAVVEGLVEHLVARQMLASG